MSKGVNKVMILGNLGTDPEVRNSSAGPIVNIRVATTEIWKDKSGMKQERTEWHKIVLFNKVGEIAAKYLKKGSKVFIEGSLRTNKWQDQSGVERFSTEIIASSIQLLDSRQGFEAQQELPKGVTPISQNSINSAEDELDDVPF